MSAIGFGAFKIGRNQGIKYAQSYELPDDQTVAALLNGVLDLGVTYIDTAPAYGISEERIGKFLGHRRREFVLSTKVGERFEAGQSTYDFSPAAVHASLAQSLRNLRMDVLDIVFVHAPRADQSLACQSDLVKALQEAKSRGLVRAIGFSGYSAPALQAALAWADALMLEYHPQNPLMEPVIAAARAQDRIVVVKKGLASGTLAAAGSIDFIFRNPAVTSLVIGSLSLQHMADNVRIAREARGRHP